LPSPRADVLVARNHVVPPNATQVPPKKGKDSQAPSVWLGGDEAAPASKFKAQAAARPASSAENLISNSRPFQGMASSVLWKNAGRARIEAHSTTFVAEPYRKTAFATQAG
jgi:hypothetical protein